MIIFESHSYNKKVTASECCYNSYHSSLLISPLFSSSFNWSLHHIHIQILYRYQTICQTYLLYTPLQLSHIHHYHISSMHLNFLLVSCCMHLIAYFFVDPFYLLTCCQYLLQFYHNKIVLFNHWCIHIYCIWVWILKHSVTDNFSNKSSMLWINSLHGCIFCIVYSSVYSSDSHFT